MAPAAALAAVLCSVSVVAGGRGAGEGPVIWVCCVVGASVSSDGAMVPGDVVVSGCVVSPPPGPQATV
ncbi:MAG: hypothetical protein M3511_12960, partial [Deinococcota bacterium]|nr:hypothetical protein [Deinococcota bacterium]